MSEHRIIETALTGRRLLADSFLSKGSAFTDEERTTFGLHGLLPFHLSSLDEQLNRNYENFRACRTPLEKYVFLGSLQDRNEVLFYRLVQDHLAEMMPIIYTPTVGEACQQYSHIFRRARGLYIAYPHIDHIEAILDSYPAERIDAMVVTDGERILGLGDLGVGGMGIPVGKLALYTLCAGIHPLRTLPVFLDTGTNNDNLLRDPLYLGWRNPRIRGADYDGFIQRFVAAVKKRWPQALIQWEDFAKDNAGRILDRYRGEVPSFNDDIQGTAAVTLAGLMRASQAAGRPFGEERLIIAGAGSAATGIAQLMCEALEENGRTADQARAQVWLVDTKGLVHAGRNDLSEEKKQFCQTPDTLKAYGLQAGKTISLADAVGALEPTALVGVTGKPGTFDEALVKQMASRVQTPIIFPLSNPTANSEATPDQLLRWTDGRALVATGSPFEPVQMRDRRIPIGQCNNAFIFPGVGLGLIVTQAREVPDDVFRVAARTLAQFDKRPEGYETSLFPDLRDVRDISERIAQEVAQTIIDLKLAGTSPTDNLIGRIRQAMWSPAYPILKRLS